MKSPSLFKQQLHLLLTIVVVCVTGLATVKGAPTKQGNPPSISPGRQKVLLLFHAQDVPAQEVYHNAIKALNDAHFSYDEFDLAQPTQWPVLSQYTTILLATELIRRMEAPQTKLLASYVKDGGNMVIVYRAWHKDLGPVFGAQIENLARRIELLENSSGLRFHVELMPGISGLMLDKTIIPSNGAYGLKANLDVLVIASDDKRRPLVWLNTYGRGRVLYWNTTFLSSKVARGLIVQSILHVQPLSILPIANAAAIDIDSFPAPLSEQRLDPIAEEYNIPINTFYHQVWLPDMLDLARRYQMPFTFFVRFADSKKTQAPFDFAAWEAYKIKVNDQPTIFGVYAADLIRQNHQLGIVGYNSRPLSLKYWSSQAEMAAGLQAAAARWQADNLGPLPQVLSSAEMIDSTGAAAIAQAFPTVKIISTLALKDYEFGPAKDIPGLSILPRTTNGYVMLPTEQLAMLAQLGGIGAWTHVIYPDDLLANPVNYPETPPYRNPDTLPWRGDKMGKTGLYHKLEQWLDFAKTYYPWLRYMPSMATYTTVLEYLNNNVLADFEPEGIRLQTEKPTYFQIRINNGARLDTARLQGAEVVHVYESKWFTLYTLKGHDTRIHAPLAEGTDDLARLRKRSVSSFETPAPGELIISEFMVNTAGKEWVEVYNRSDHTLNLAGVKLIVSDKVHVIDPEAILRIAPGGYAVLAQTKGPDNGLQPDQILYAYGSDLKLGDRQGSIALQSVEGVVDTISYDLQQRWPIEQGISVGLLLSEFTASGHHDGMKWCQSIKPLPNNPRQSGTPGQPNHTCARSTPEFNSPSLIAQSGELVITEILVGVSDPRLGAEWFEIYNPTDRPVSLRGVTIATRSVAKGEMITADIFLNPGQYMVLAQSVSQASKLPKDVPVYYYGHTLKLNNDFDALYLRRGTQLIDGVVFNKTQPWPLNKDIAMALHPGAISAYLNDDALNWCHAWTPMKDRPALKGTLGLTNDPCPMWDINSPLVDDPGAYTQDSLEPIEMRVKVDPAQLEFLISNPFTRQRFPAVFEADGLKVEPGKPNATLRIRGASTRWSLQKSFAIQLTTGDFRGQKTIQLNKHPYDGSRMRNYAGYTLFRNIKHMMSLRTQFVRLYINDKDFGLYTQVERIGGRFIEAHHLEDRGALFKVSCRADITCFAFEAPPAQMRASGRIDGIQLEVGSGYDGLFKMLDALNKEEDINVVVDRHFNRDNLITYLATMYLIRNLDIINQNLVLYSTAREPERFYLIPWDLDYAFIAEPGTYKKNERWWRGFGFLNQVYLWRRFLQNPANAREVQAKIDELMKTSLSRNTITSIVDRGAVQVAPFIARGPELRAYLEEKNWIIAVDAIKTTTEDAYADLQTTIKWPMPVFTHIQYLPEGTILFSWDESFTLDGSPITYDLVFFDSAQWDETRIVHSIRGFRNNYIELRPEDFPAFMRGNKEYHWMVYIWNDQGDYQTSFLGETGGGLEKVRIP